MKHQWQPLTINVFSFLRRETGDEITVKDKDGREMKGTVIGPSDPLIVRRQGGGTMKNYDVNEGCYKVKVEK